MDSPLDVLNVVDDSSIKCTALLGEKYASSVYYVGKQR